MKYTISYLMAAAVLLGLLSGCTNVGHISESGTSVSLAGNNYRLLKPGASGHSSGFRLLGIIPFASPNYAGAKASLYKSVGQPLTGKAVALANETEDRSTLYLILFSIPKITITADVVEFIDAPASPDAAPKQP